jgi:hypothetical protein
MGTYYGSAIEKICLRHVIAKFGSNRPDLLISANSRQKLGRSWALST